MAKAKDLGLKLGDLVRLGKKVDYPVETVSIITGEVTTQDHYEFASVQGLLLECVVFMEITFMLNFLKILWD